MILDDPREIEIGDGIAADHDKGLIEEFLGLLHAAGRAQGSLLNRILNVHAQALTIAKVVLDGFGHVLQGNHHIDDAMTLE